jgi:hypothetical protein
MAAGWNQAQFDQFIEMRDTLREAKREGRHSTVLAVGAEIVSFEKEAPAIGIVLYVFLKDMAQASEKLGDNSSAMEHLANAQADVTKRGAGRFDDAWQRELGIIERKIEKLRKKRP